MNVLNVICHRNPERSFFIKGHQFPVCSRCTGFYISLIMYFTYTYYYYVNYTPELLLSAGLLLIPTGIDGITQFFEFRESNNILRFITGFVGAIGLILMARIFKIILFQLFL